VNVERCLVGRQTTDIAAKPLQFMRSNVCGFPETEINLENTADLVGISRENGENRGKTAKTLLKTVNIF
jgi:hypothetical protein